MNDTLIYWVVVWMDNAVLAEATEGDKPSSRCWASGVWSGLQIDRQEGK